MGFAALIVSSVGDVARKSILRDVLIVALKVSRPEVNTTGRIDGDHNRDSVHIQTAFKTGRSVNLTLPL